LIFATIRWLFSLLSEKGDKKEEEKTIETLMEKQDCGLLGSPASIILREKLYFKSCNRNDPSRRNK
jgi:hypothetical protein